MRDIPYLETCFKRKDIVFLTDHGDTDYLRGLRINVKGRISRIGILKIFPEWVTVGIALFLRGMWIDNAVYVTFGSCKSTYVLMILQKLVSWISRPKPHILFDCLWDAGDSTYRRMINRLRASLVSSVVSKCVVYGRADLKRYNERLGIPREKLVFVRYHHTLSDFEDKVTEGNYVFSGGTPGRDYGPLIQVCRELSIPLKIATFDADAIKKAKGNHLFDVRTTSSEEFRKWMANCRLVVMPFNKTIARTVGHQTFINAMMMGKAMIIYNEDFADGYVEDGVTGVVIPYGNLEKLKVKTQELYNSEQMRRKLGGAARDWVIAEELKHEQWVYEVYNIAAGECYCLALAENGQRGSRR